MKRVQKRVMLASLVLGGLAGNLRAELYSFTTIDYPGGTSEFAYGISNGQVSGSYFDGNGNHYGFSWTAGGGFEQLSVPGSIRNGP